MSKERHSDPSGWKERIQEPGAVPGWCISDKEAIWDRLHARLGNPARRIRAVWYWVAAALLLLIGLTVAPYKQWPGTELAASGSGKPYPGSVAPGSSPAPRLRELVSAPVSQRPAGRLRHTVSAPGARLPLAIRATSPGPISIKSPSLLFNRLPENMGSRLPGLTTSQRKEMKIVQINELDHPTGRTSSMAGSRPAGSSWFRFRKPNDLDRGSSYPQQEEGAGPTTNTVLTIHLSPQN